MAKRRRLKPVESFVVTVVDNWTEQQIYEQKAPARKRRKPSPPKSFAQAMTGDKWTEPDMFESLCKVMLTELVGRQFRRAKAGFQGGRDIDADPGGIVTHVECKRYSGTRPVGRPPHHVRRFHANFSYQVGQRAR